MTWIPATVFIDDDGRLLSPKGVILAQLPDGYRFDKRAFDERLVIEVERETDS